MAMPSLNKPSRLLALVFMLQLGFFRTALHTTALKLSQRSRPRHSPSHASRVRQSLGMDPAPGPSHEASDPLLHLLKCKSSEQLAPKTFCQASKKT